MKGGGGERERERERERTGGWSVKDGVGGANGADGGDGANGAEVARGVARESHRHGTPPTVSCVEKARWTSGFDMEVIWHVGGIRLMKNVKNLAAR